MKLLLVLALAVCVLSQTQLNYNIGDDFTFQFSSQLNHAADGAPSQAATSSMTGIMEMEVQDWDGKLYYFVMNLFNVDVEATNGVRSARGTKSRTRITSGDDGLGPDMYFSMTPQGQIPTIWYQEGDSQFFINVKASAISALQTRLVPANSPQIYQEQDLIGTHTTNFNATFASKTGLSISKSFTQQNIIQFADKQITKATFNLTGMSVVNVHPSGYITGSSSSQKVTFASATATAKKNPKLRAAPLGFDSELMSHGTLVLNLLSKGAKRLPTSVASAKKATTLFEIGSTASLSPLTNIPKIKSAQELVSMLTSTKKTDYQQLRSIVRFFKANPALVTVWANEINRGLYKPVQQAWASVFLPRWLYILGMLNLPESNAVLREMLHHEQTRAHVLRLLPASSVSDCSLIQLLGSFVDTNDRDAALIAIGSLSRRCPFSQAQKKAQELLSQKAQEGQRTNDKGLLHAARAGLENAGVNTHHSAIVADTGLYPFNRSYDKNLTVGGNQLNANFQLDLFVGTNFDCRQNYFNYEASAVASATLNFLGDSKSAFLGKAIYGTANGQRLENILYLRVWDDVIYNTPIPTIDCSQHTYPIASYKSPGLDVTYTIWVTIIPVTFTAGLDVEMNLSWGWNICDTDLSAQVELIPDGKLVASAGAVSDLIILEGGITLSADFEIIPEPKAFIHGSQCQVGVDVSATYDPMQASIDVWWRQNECTWWIFDCHWGPYHRDNLWSWSAAEKHVVLYHKTWDIAPSQ